VFLVLRRLIFMGVALPQISSTGIAFFLSLPLWLGWSITASNEHALALTGSTIFSLTAILFFAFLERLGQGLSEGRLGTLYVVASAVSILLLSKNRYGERGWLDLLKGDVIAISNADLIMTVIVLMAILLVLAMFYKELLLISYDRILAMTLGKNVMMWDIL